MGKIVGESGETIFDIDELIAIQGLIARQRYLRNVLEKLVAEYNWAVLTTRNAGHIDEDHGPVKLERKSYEGNA